MPVLSGTVQSAPEGAKGFDANTPVSAGAARQFLTRGYRFCVRYVGRLTSHPGDLTYAEAEGILGAGLALMVVQHVQAENGWSPTGALGTTYGVNAAAFAREAGVPSGVNLWLDLEGVATGTAAADVIAYCQNWHHAVSDAGYLPGVYVGWRPGLSGPQLYALPFQRYWGAYNVDGDSTPACGWSLKQSPASGGAIGGITTDLYDDNVTHTDRAGRNVQWLAPG